MLVLIPFAKVVICYMTFGFRFAAQDPSFTGKGANAVFRDKEGMHHAYACHVLVILVAVTSVDIQSFCANIDLVMFPRKTDKSRRHTEGKGR
jgi:hypothetical protein